MPLYAQFWTLAHAPVLAVVAVWCVACRTRGGWVLAIGSVLLMALLGVDARSVWGDGLPVTEPTWGMHLRWTVLGALLWARSTGSRQLGLGSTLFAAGAAALHGWLAAVACIGLGVVEGLGWSGRFALAWLGLCIWASAHGAFPVANRLGFLGLGIDSTTLAAHVLIAFAEAAGWAWFLATGNPSAETRCP